MRHIFIINPISGKSDASQLLTPQIKTVMQAAKQPYQIIRTEAPGHAVELARQCAEQQEPVRLYACGGDGTLNEVLCGAWRFENAEVACIPCGSGNDFVRNFDGVNLFSDLQAQLEGSAISIDLMDVGEDRVAAVICSAGLDAQVAYGIPKFRRIPFCGGQMAYHLSVVQQVCGPLGHRLHVQTSEETFEDEFLMAAICNGSCYGGGYQASPKASLNDGLLDLVLVKKVSRLRIASVVGIYKNGKHIQNGEIRQDLRPIIQLVRTREVSITVRDDRPLILNIDGECGPGQQLQARVLPGAARFVLPKGAVMHNACPALIQA